MKITKNTNLGNLANLFNLCNKILSFGSQMKPTSIFLLALIEIYIFATLNSKWATVQNSPANIVPQFQSRPNQSRTIQSRRHFSLGDNLVQDNLVQTIQSEPMQSRQFSLANLVQKNLVQVYFQDSLVWKPIQSRGLFSPRQFSPFQYSLGTNIV